MIVILLILSMVAQVAQQVFRKEYEKRRNDESMCFSLIGVIVTLLYFVIMSGGRLQFDCFMLSYAIPFSVCYTIAYVCTIYAIKNGPLSLTSLIISCSVVVPVIYCILILGEPFGVKVGLALFMFLSAILFVSEPWKKSETVINLKWALYSAATFFSNGFCMVLQKRFQVNDKSEHMNEFMICSLGISAFVLLAFSLVKEREKIKTFLKRKIIWPILVGAGNGLANQTTMMLAVILPASFLYPVQSAGAMILTGVISIAFYKEKLSAFQKAGFMLGILAIVLFNI